MTLSFCIEVTKDHLTLTIFEYLKFNSDLSWETLSLYLYTLLLRAIRTVCSALVFLKTEFGGREVIFAWGGCDNIRDTLKSLREGSGCKYAPFKRQTRLVTLAAF